MKYNIALIPGDGIGPDVIAEAVSVLEKIGGRYGHTFTFTEVDAGGIAIDKHGEPLPAETVKICKNSDSVMLGAVGGYKWDVLPGNMRPERALLGLRGELKLYANLRPAVLYEALKDACPLRNNNPFDVLVVRELTGGMYFGDRGRKQSEMGETAWDTESYSYEEIKRISVAAFDAARKRSKRVTSVDKANVLESSRLWRETVIAVHKDYQDIELTHMYVDNASMQLIKNPAQFDVLLTTNMFGDILSDEASQLTGSIGLLPSASLGAGSLGLYEPIHGSAPDIAGKNLANPIATILSTAMMLNHSFGLAEEANAIEKAVADVLNDGYRTGDIMSEGMKNVGTREMGRLIAERI